MALKIRLMLPTKYAHCFCGLRFVVISLLVRRASANQQLWKHDDVIKWKYFPRCWPFVRGIHWSPVNSPHIGQWRGALIFSLIYTRINGWVNNGEAGDLRHHRAQYDATVMNKDKYIPRILDSRDVFISLLFSVVARVLRQWSNLKKYD